LAIPVFGGKKRGGVMLPERLANHILRVEGGLADLPADRGGRTYRGITVGTLAEARRDDPSLPGDPADLSEDQVREIYFRRYYLPARCGDLPPPADLLLFDAVVHHGLSGGVRLFQRGINRLMGLHTLAADGVFGPRTLAAARGLVRGELTAPGDRALGVAVLLERAFFFHDFSSRIPAQRVFLPGWLRRLREVAAVAGV